jgi:hypothetical protein
VIKNETILDSTSSIALPDSLRDSRELCVEKLVNEIMMLSGSGGGGIVIRDRPLMQMRDESSDISDENSSKDVDLLGSDFGSPSGSDGKEEEFGSMDFTSYSSSYHDEDEHCFMDKTLAPGHDVDFLSGSLGDVNEQPSFMFKDDPFPLLSLTESGDKKSSVLKREGSIIVSASPLSLSSAGSLNGNFAFLNTEKTVLCPSLVPLSASLPPGYTSTPLTGPSAAHNGDVAGVTVASSGSCAEVCSHHVI